MTIEIAPGIGLIAGRLVMDTAIKLQRPELGSWHTITSYAYKSHWLNGIVWKSSDIDNYLPDRGKWIYKGDETPPPAVSWGNNWEYQRTKMESCPAMYIGYRYKRNGNFSYNYDTHEFDSHYQDFGGFEVREAVEVWMFVVYATWKPIPVFPFVIENTITT